MPNFIYPQSFVSQEIEPELMARARAGRVGLDLFPEKKVNAVKVRWWQLDDFYGLQQMRGLNGQPSHVKNTGTKAYEYEPGYYGEHMTIDETELLTRAGSSPEGTPIDVSDAIGARRALLINREADRMEWLAWQAVQGSVIVTLGGDNGTQRTYTDTYAVQTYAAAVPWATTATATPILNFQAAQQLGVGASVDFGPGATAYMNQVTANRLINNGNSSDLGGRRDNYGATINNLAGIASYWQGQGLPKIVVYDKGYRPTITATRSQYQKFIADGVVIIVGQRPGNAALGNMVQTRNTMNPAFAPGPYSFIKDYAAGVNAPKEVPPRIEIHRGWNGGPVVYYPSAIIKMTV